MAKKVVSDICGIHPDHQTFHRLIFYEDDTVRIIRPWCPLITWRHRQPCQHDDSNAMEILEEPTKNHRWLIHIIRENALPNGDSTPSR